MRICYIKQAENLDEYINYTSKVKIKFIKNIIKDFKRIFNIITIKPIGDGILFYVPYKKNKEVKLANKISKKLNFYNITDIVIDNKLKIDSFIKRLYEFNINILDGRWLFNYLLIDVIEYISKTKDENIQNQEVSLLVNDLNEVAVNNIYELANKIKRLNIVTNNIGKFKNIEKNLYEQKGIMITVSNNKRKSLAKAKIILNLDFPEEVINKYNINRKAIIVNVEENININSKSFNGININYYNIKIKEEILKKFIENNMLDNFDKAILYESILYNKNRYQKIREKINRDEIEIIDLIGKNGVINKKEFEIL